MVVDTGSRGERGGEGEGSHRIELRTEEGERALQNVSYLPASPFKWKGEGRGWFMHTHTRERERT